VNNVGTSRLSEIALIAMLIGSLGLAETYAGDWPQILGPNRNGQADGEKLSESWPQGGPKQLWKKPVGQGYAGPAVAANRVIMFHRINESERIEALDAKTGDQIWQIDFKAEYGGGINSDTGPRCVPIIDSQRDRVFVYGAAGDVHCVSFSKGAKIWSRSVRSDYRADDGYFGAGSTPVVAGDNLLINVGGDRADAGIVALSVDTGKTVWKATNEQASYSSPVIARIDGKPSVVFVTRMNAVCLEPTDGSILFRFPFGQRGPTVNAASPLVIADTLFLTASYGIGAKLVRMRGKKTETVWDNDEVMSSQYVTPVHHAGYLYGIDGREDIGVASLRCIDAKSGNVKWSEDRFGIAHVILANDKLLVVKVESGEEQLILAKASPDRFQKLASARILSDGVARALPSLSNGRLFVRSNSGAGGELKCIEVGQ